MESTTEPEVTKRDPAAAGAQRMARLFRVLVLGGVVLAVACASVPRGATNDPDGGPSDGGGGGVPSW
jgi:hypothetical protein